MLSRLFLSDAAWRIVPLATSAICLAGFYAASMLHGIARRNHVNHESDEFRFVARFLERRAIGRALALLLLTVAGALVTVAGAYFPIPPRSGIALAMWANHYLVGSMATILSTLALLDLRDRLRL